MYKFKKGDEIQACGNGRGWVVGTFVEYKNGNITMEGCCPLYDFHTVWDNAPTLTFMPTAVWIYGEGEKPVFTWPSSDFHEPLEQFITE
jgi:hypothetical protein